MSAPTLIDAVIVSYNSRATLRGCVEPLSQLDDVAVKVVDNACPHDSTSVVADLPVDIIRAGRNGGFAAGCNVGIAHGEAPYVLLLNPDARLLPGALEALVCFMQRHPRVGVAGARLLYPDGRPQAAAWRFPTLAMALFDLFPPRGPLLGRLYGSYLNGRYPEEQCDLPFPIDHPLGALMLIRRQALDEVGLFDEGYWLYAEEVDWCYRCRQAGWTIWQVPAARAVHVAGAASSQFRGRSFVALHRSRLRYVRKWYSPRRQGLYAAIVHAGMLWRSLDTWGRWLGGRITADELRAHLLAYGKVQQLAGGSSTS